MTPNALKTWLSSNLGLQLTSSSIDLFRRQVYRPRLALLLLVLLVSPNNEGQLVSRSSSIQVDPSLSLPLGSAQPIIDKSQLSHSHAQPRAAERGSWIHAKDLLVHKARKFQHKGNEPAHVVAKETKLLESRGAPSLELVQSGRGRPASTSPKDRSSKNTSPEPDLIKREEKTLWSSLTIPMSNPLTPTFLRHHLSTPTPPTAPDPTSGSAKTDRGGPLRPQSQPAPGTVFKLPKPSLGLLLDPHVLPVILPLHLLWGIRLLGMAVEDGSIHRSLFGPPPNPRSKLFSLTELILLFISSLAIASPSFLGLLTRWCREHYTGSPDPDQAPILPLQLLVLLEFFMTSVSLLSPLSKLEPALGLIPDTVTLPSPSHSPSLLELLPLPKSLVAFLTGETAAAASAEVRRRRGGARHGLAGLGQPTAAHLGSRDGDGGTFNHADASDLDHPDSPVVSAPIATPGGRVAPRHVPHLENPLVVEMDRSTQLAAMPSTPSRSGPSYGGGLTRRGKAPRLKNQSVSVETRWLIEVLIPLLTSLVGALEYSMVTLSLPTLSPTSLPPVLSLLSLRNELGNMTKVWSSARRSVECLEFVRRRWGVMEEDMEEEEVEVDPPGSWISKDDEGGDEAVEARRRRGKEKTSRPWRPEKGQEVFCPICFESTRSGSSQAMEQNEPSPDPKARREAWKSLELEDVEEEEGTGGEKTLPTKEARKEKGRERRKKKEGKMICRLDCGHELHPICLVSWLIAQSFCPTCHEVLSIAPPRGLGRHRRRRQHRPSPLHPTTTS
ncbi:hypothetical protein IE53DRAFT_51376 [Violaceomyces palustris]|uniref:Uncharacterized protein n=1 Tax=Violaceomyces palustris TaxID=1673888 RepID=A0ACD0P017_9BASI|nr:hypothetical protein IE53DRAFT_51376 [Violaceomyces palustris]